MPAEVLVQLSEKPERKVGFRDVATRSRYEVEEISRTATIMILSSQTPPPRRSGYWLEQD